MNKLLITLLIVQAAFAVNSKEIRSKKLAREGTVRPSKVEYIKTNNLTSSMLNGGLHEFYESVFSTRIDHFRPLNQQRVNFVRSAYYPFTMYLFKFIITFRPTMRILTTSKTLVPSTFTLKTLSIIQPIRLKKA